MAQILGNLLDNALRHTPAGVPGHLWSELKAALAAADLDVDIGEVRRITATRGPNC